MKLIDLTENGSNIKKSIVVDKIKSFEPLIYKTNGIKVTVIMFTDGTEIHVDETVSRIKELLSSL